MFKIASDIEVRRTLRTRVAWLATLKTMVFVA